MNELSKPKPASSGRIIKWLFAFLVSIFILIVVVVAAGVLYLNHWLKTGDVKSFTEQALSKVTGGIAAFDALEIDPAGKIIGKSFVLLLPDGSRISIADFDVEANLKSVLTGKLVFEHVYINKPHVILISKPDKEKPETGRGLFFTDGGRREKDVPLAARFPVPFAVEVKAGKIEGLSIDFRRDDLRINITGLKLISKMYISREQTETQALFTTTNKSALSFRHNDLTAEIDPDISFRASMNETTGNWTLLGGADLLFEKVTGPYKVEPGSVVMDITANGNFSRPFSGVARIDASLYDEPAIDISAKWKENESGLSYSLKSNLIKLDLTRLSRLYGASDVHIEGVLDMTSFDAKGLIPEKQKDAEHEISAKGAIDLSELVLSKALAPKGMKVAFALNKVKVSSKEFSGELDAGFSAQELAAFDIEIKQTEMSVKADLSGAVPGKDAAAVASGDVAFSFSVDNFKRKDFHLNKISFEGAAAGEFMKGDLENAEITGSVGGALDVKLTGSMTGYGRDKLSVKADFAASLEKWKNVLRARSAPFHFSKGGLTGVVKVDGNTGEEWKRPRLNFDAAVKLDDAAGKNAKPEMTFSSSSADIKASGRINQLMTVTDLEIDLKSRSSGVTMPGLFSSGPFTLNATASSPDPQHDKVTGSLAFRSKRVALDKKNRRNHFPVDITLEGETDPVTGRHVLRTGRVSFGKSGSLSSKGWVDTEQNIFKANLQALSLDLELLRTFALKKWPDKLRALMVAGGLSFTINADGAIPVSAEEMMYPLPFGLSLAASVRDGAVVMEKQGVKSKGVDLDLQIEARKSDIRVNGGIWAESFVSKKLFGRMELDPTLEFDLELTKGEKLRINQLVVDTTALGFVHAVEGSVTGFNARSLVAEGFRPVELFPKLSFNLENYFSVVLDKRQRFLTDLDITGDATFELSIKADAQRSLSFDGTGQFRNLSIQKGKKKLVEKLFGRFPFTKTLKYGASDTEKRKTASTGKPATKAISVRETSFFEDLRKTGGGRESFTVGLIEAGPVALRDTMFDVYFKESRLGVDYFKTSLLGGGLTGSFQIKRKDGSYVLRTTENFAGLDLQQMLEHDFGLTHSEAQIDGAMNMEIAFRADDEVKEIGIANIDASVNLSRIGSKALDKLLLFIDPKESSPAVANARAIIKIANPTRVELTAKHGQLSLVMGLKYSPVLGGTTVTVPVIKRAPIHSLANIESIRKPLQKLSALKTVMRVIGATRIVFTKEGAIKLQ